VDTSKNNGQIGKVIGTIGTSAQWNQEAKDKLGSGFAILRFFCHRDLPEWALPEK